jgi:hypothetical protein
MKADLDEAAADGEAEARRRASALDARESRLGKRASELDARERAIAQREADAAANFEDAKDMAAKVAALASKMNRKPELK